MDASPDIYVTIRKLPSYPKGPCAYVVRQPGRTLLVCDPRAPRMDITAYCVDHLTVPECNEIRRAYGLPPIGTHAGDFITDGPAFLYVPEELRLAGEPALQGGDELDRRHDVGDLDVELAAVYAERGGRLRQVG